MKLTFEHRGIPIALSVLMSIVFIAITVSNAINFPAAADDFILFVQQLHHKLLTSSGAKDAITYFFAPAFGIHTKLSSRVLGLLSYGIFGVIDFKFLIIAGNVCYLFMAHKISDIAAKINEEAYLRPIILSLLLVPLALNFRPVFITGFPFHILFAFLCFVFLTRKKIGISFLFFLLTTFCAGPGVFTGLVSFAALVIYSFRDKKYIPYALLYLTMASVLLVFIFLYKTPATESSLNLSFSAIASYIVYVLVFVQKSVTPYLIDYGNLPIVYMLIGIAICSIIIYLLVRKFQETTNSSFFYLCIYLLILGALAGVVRDGGTSFLPNVAARYEHYSVVFVASFIGLIYGFISSSKIKVGIGIFFLILFFMRFYTNTISHTSGYQYDTFVTRNGKTLRKLMKQKKYQYLHNFKYENIAQNVSLQEAPKKGKRINTSGISIFKHVNEPEIGILSFMFKEKKEYKNIRVILQQGKNVYGFEPYQTKSNRYYCLIANNGDLPKGEYRLRIWYEDEQGKYERKLTQGKKMEFN